MIQLIQLQILNQDLFSEKILNMKNIKKLNIQHQIYNTIIMIIIQHQIFSIKLQKQLIKIIQIQFQQQVEMMGQFLSMIKNVQLIKHAVLWNNIYLIQTLFYKKISMKVLKKDNYNLILMPLIYKDTVKQDFLIIYKIIKCPLIYGNLHIKIWFYNILIKFIQKIVQKLQKILI
ncbi:hypothetical protein IMG5_099910 [Ichthyophthirius multifiliis]|uniref:Uncharacterized protein n=1 Tax=Ichthyophthirius multifiliis TaxID=5932 RepID=G0QS89_ICHMU|nr:hypothetical protein IMG5_099910 [Ichthyophthirius multifiliis]EGR31911.1 hypothetical protein IMG5_099910 [Ichthyophthirius multifiliis]|eukprot:XP_004035397.1 hypothetical protein IMG5_099910 [Ichthyophthirius multifiliis]